MGQAHGLKAHGSVRDTQCVDASVQTIRLLMLRLGAQLRSSVRRIHLARVSGCPNQSEFDMVYLARLLLPLQWRAVGEFGVEIK
jgi:hypothetical protein